MVESLTRNLQESLLTLLGYDDEAGKTVANLIAPEYFEGDYRIIAERCIEYHKKYNKAPGPAHVKDLLSDILDDPHNRKKRVYVDIIDSMHRASSEIDPRYVLDWIQTHLRKQNLVDAVIRSADLLQQKNAEYSIQEVEEIWSGLLRADKKVFSSGLKITEVDRIIDYLGRQFDEFRTGIPELDRNGIVPYRGAVMLFLASTGMGKSWWLIHLGRQAIMLRKKVLHISLEMSEEEVAARYIQNICSVSSRNRPSQVTEIEKDGFKITGLHTLQISPELSYDDPIIREQLKIHLEALGARINNLHIKRFPTRTLTISGLEAYLDTLERTEGFVPDMLLLDYMGIMKTDLRDHRISLGRTFEDFRSIAVSRNIAAVTAQQTGRRGANAQLVRDTDVSEDWSLVGTADRAITYSSTAQEHKHGLARLYSTKARSARDKFTVLITQNYDLGQFVLDSVLLDDRYWDRLKDFDGDDEEEDLNDDD